MTKTGACERKPHMKRLVFAAIAVAAILTTASTLLTDRSGSYESNPPELLAFGTPPPVCPPFCPR